MKKVVIIFFAMLVVLIAVFFVVDYSRVKNQELPVFCIKSSVMEDGGTVEYYGLGYKVIDFNTIEDFDEIKIGTWFMKYNDFSKEHEEFARVFFEVDVERIDSSRIEEEDRKNETKIVKLFSEEFEVTYKYTRGDRIVYEDSNQTGEYIFKDDKLSGFIRDLPENKGDKISEKEAEKIANDFIKDFFPNRENIKLELTGYRYGEYSFKYVEKYFDCDSNNTVSIAVFDNGEITSFQYHYDEKYEKLNSMSIDRESIKDIFRERIAVRYDV
ncbi:MAG: hypothetical protein IJO27_04675, partial [Bacilli bacterium]|nr:hypothetical protein [Bacilli bacterium]